jgi:hypothetical protein
MRSFERTISSKLDNITDWPKLVAELRRLSFLQVQKERGSPDAMATRLQELGNYTEEHFKN